MPNRYLHIAVRRLLAWSASNRERYPQTCEAIQILQDAVDKEASPPAKKARAQRTLLTSSLKRKLKSPATGGVSPATGGVRNTGYSDYSGCSSGACRAWRSRQKAKVLQLTSQLAAHTFAKSIGGRLSEEWILRVMLTAPNVSGRAMAESFHLVVGSDRNMVS